MDSKGVRTNDTIYSSKLFQGLKSPHFKPEPFHNLGIGVLHHFGLAQLLKLPRALVMTFMHMTRTHIPNFSPCRKLKTPVECSVIDTIEKSILSTENLLRFVYKSKTRKKQYKMTGKNHSLRIRF